MGRVASSAQSCDLSVIYNKDKIDLQEYYYRIMVYIDYVTSEEVVHDKEFSEAFSVIFRNGTENHLKVRDNNKTNSFPIVSEMTEYPNEKENTILSIEIKVDTNNMKKIPLVKESHPHASKLKVKTDSGVMSVAKEDAKFTYSGIYGEGYHRHYRIQYDPTYQQEYVNHYDTQEYYYAQYYYPYYGYLADEKELEDTYNYSFDMPTGGYYWEYIHRNDGRGYYYRTTNYYYDGGSYHKYQGYIYYTPNYYTYFYKYTYHQSNFGAYGYYNGYYRSGETYSPFGPIGKYYYNWKFEYAHPCLLFRSYGDAGLIGWYYYGYCPEYYYSYDQQIRPMQSYTTMTSHQEYYYYEEYYYQYIKGYKLRNAKDYYYYIDSVSDYYYVSGYRNVSYSYYFYSKF